MLAVCRSSAAAVAVGCLLALSAGPAPALEAPAGVYRGFLAFDFKGKEIREFLMVKFAADGTATMGAEEGHDEPVSAETGIATRNDFEAANLGLWRPAGDGGLEFGTQQFRAGSGFCAGMNRHGEGLLPTCSFILTARLMPGAEVRGQTCDLGGTGGRLAVQTVDGSETDPDPFDLGLTIDYCLTRMTLDAFLELAPPG